MPDSPESPADLTISAATLLKLEALAGELGVPPETIIETAAVLLETLLAYNRKGYSRATLKHAIFRNANKEIDIDIPAAADYYAQKAQKERQMNASLGRTLKPATAVKTGEAGALEDAPTGFLEAKLVDLTLKVDAIAGALHLLLGEADLDPALSPTSGKLAGSALAELEDFTRADEELDETEEAEADPEHAPIKPPANPLRKTRPHSVTPTALPGKAAGAAAFAELDYADDAAEAAPESPGNQGADS